MPFFRKPESSPTVWHTFQRRTDEDHVRNFKVQDVSEKDKHLVLQKAVDFFTMDEPVTKYKDIKNDEVSLGYLKEFGEKALNTNISLVCYEEMADGSCSFAGFNILTITCQVDEENSQEDFEKVEGENWKQLSKLLKFAEKSVDPFSRYNIDKYLCGCGLFVPREYRGLKIGGEILKTREPLCKALGIKATVTVFTSKASQKLAAKCGYELLNEIPYNSQELLLQGIDFSGMTEVLSCKLLGIKF